MAFSVFHAGPEQQVNSLVTGNQIHPSITALPDGWLVTWSGQDSNEDGVFMQKYNLLGEPQFTSGGLAEDRLVNTTTAGSQLFSTAAALADGGWVISWLQSDGTLIQQRFASNGSVVGGEQIVNQSGTDFAKHISMAARPDGGWLVTWQVFDGDGWGIVQQRYNDRGVAQLQAGGERVNETTTGHQKNARITVLADDPLDPDDGGWIVTWVGTPDVQTQPSDPGANVYMRRFNADGTTDGADILVSAVTEFNQSAPDTVALPDGGWIVVWQSHGQDGSDAGVFMQRYSQSGVPFFAEDQQVNEAFQGAQQNPRIAVLEDGRWLVTWESIATWDVFQRLYNADGTPAGPEVRIADGSNASLYNAGATVVPTADGWVVAWQTLNQDHPSGWGISQRVFTFGAAQLTAGTDFAGGTAIGEVLQVAAGGLSDGDMIDGGDGDDTLEILEGGVLDFSRPRQFSSIEIIQGSDDDDVLAMNASVLNGLHTIDGRDGEDEIRFSTSGTYDLTSKSLIGIERISLSDHDNLILVNDVETALLLDGPGLGNTVEIAGGALTLDDRIEIFKNGIATIVHGGTTYVKSAPIIGRLSGDQIIVSAGASARLDAGLDADVTGGIGRFATLTVAIANRVANQDSLELAEGSGLTLIDDAILFNGVQVGTLDQLGEQIEITFDADAAMPYRRSFVR